MTTPTADLPADAPAPTDFDRTTRPAPTGTPGRFSAELDPGWSSLVGIHGGYLAALSVRAAEQVAGYRPARTVSTGFLATGRPGPAVVEVATVRSGRTITVLDVTVSQGERRLCTSRITAARERSGESWANAPAPDVAPVADCVPLAPPGGVAHFARAVGLLDPTYTPFSGGTRARVQGHVRPVEDRPIDGAWLAMVMDWFPPAAFGRLSPRPQPSGPSRRR